MTLLDYLKAALAKNEASHGPDDFVSKQLRAQLDSLQGEDITLPEPTTTPTTE
jgi:hypothetical protein